jgi:hypothetical protein
MRIGGKECTRGSQDVLLPGKSRPRIYRAGSPNSPFLSDSAAAPVCLDPRRIQAFRFEFHPGKLHHPPARPHPAFSCSKKYLARLGRSEVSQCLIDIDMAVDGSCVCIVSESLAWDGDSYATIATVRHAESGADHFGAGVDIQKNCIHSATRFAQHHVVRKSILPSTGTDFQKL